MPVANERKTEDLVERRLRKLGYFDDPAITVEKQQSDAPRIRKLLETASKRGPGVGRPEFLIRSTAAPDFLIVVECKAQATRHESPGRDRPADFAVDGVLLYASYLAREYDVLAIAVSGQDERSLRISHFIHLRGTPAAAAWNADPDLVGHADYHHAFLHSDAKARQDYASLLDYNRTLNNELQARKVGEAKRGFLISAILIALNSEAFRASYRQQKTAKALAGSLLATIRAEFDNADLPPARREDLVQAFSFIARDAALDDRDFFIRFIQGVDENINAFMRTHRFYDTIGHFYIEFLRYANNDKGLGIVLTPHHIAELFVELAEVDRTSIVFDNCCGTAGLLIAAMKAMMKDAGSDKKAQKRILESQVHGIEFQSEIYALAVSNMILHGDGKTNIHRGDCFKEDIFARRARPTVGLLNPPYKNKRMKEDREELEFVLNNLETLAPGGRCVAIVPITCATTPDGTGAMWKQQLLDRHTLEGVMSMPTELFHNSKTTVVTCVMVFTAHKPHPPGKKSWFGYWRDDGFVKTKHRGRHDGAGRWTDVKARWVSSFRNREVRPGESVMREVGATDEWCAEAYLETDYARIQPRDLAESIKRYYMAQIAERHGEDEDAETDED